MISEWEMCVRLLLAAFFGSLIGFQREHLFWTAGLRTHMMVAAGSCLFMIVSAYGFEQALTMPGTRLDPSRIAAQIVSGIGFLGAGSIMMRGDVIKGLTTASSLWVVAAIGMTVGGGLYGLAGAATVLILFILMTVTPLERKYRSYLKTHVIRLVAPTGVVTREVLDKLLGERADRVKQVIIYEGPDVSVENIVVEFKKTTRYESFDMLKTILTLPGVRSEGMEHSS